MDLQAELARMTRFVRLVQKVSCDSTQALAQQDQSPEAGIFWADHQTAGRGRQGRSWDDEPGVDIAATFRVPGLQLPRPTQLAAAVPLAMLRALGPHVEGLNIKWPNDLLCRGKKICGVLIDTPEPRTYLIGIGVNINRCRFPAELADHATSLRLAAGREFDRAGILLAMALQLDTVLEQLGAGLAASLGEEFAQGLGLLGSEVQLVHAGTAECGLLQALDLDSATLADGRQFALAHLQQLRPA